MVTAVDLRDQLRRLGYEVSGMARSGEEAIRLTEQLNPDLILMDLKLAGPMTGVQASHQIQELKPIPIVYLTGFPDVFVRNPDQMRQPGMCLSKPFSIPELHNLLEIALRS